MYMFHQDYGMSGMSGKSSHRPWRIQSCNSYPLCYRNPVQCSPIPRSYFRPSRLFPYFKNTSKMVCPIWQIPAWCAARWIIVVLESGIILTIFHWNNTIVNRNVETSTAPATMPIDYRYSLDSLAFHITLSLQLQRWISRSGLLHIRPDLRIAWNISPLILQILATGLLAGRPVIPACRSEVSMVSIINP